MHAGKALRGARRRAGLTQRELAVRAGLPYSTVARIESSAAVPRVDTLSRLLLVCGESLEVRPRRGAGVDRTLILQQLTRNPALRIAYIVDGARRSLPLVGAAVPNDR